MVENAVKFSPQGGPIKVDVSRQADFAQVDIVDHGVGIPPEDIPSLFQRFFQASSSHVSGGIGMGLALSHTIVTTHGGTIEVESVVDEGTMFRVLLPLEVES